MLKRILVILSLIAITIGYAFYQKHSLEQQLSSDESSEAILARLPEASFVTLKGESFDLKDAGAYDLLVIHYWGTWCAPCEAELPDLLTLIKRFEGKRLKFLLVAVNDEVNKIKKHLKSLAVSDKADVVWLMDNGNVHRDIFGTTRVPE